MVSRSAEERGPAGGRATVRPRAPFQYTPHLERFTLPGRPTPWLYDPGTRTLRALAPLGGGWTPVRAVFRGEPWEPTITVEAPEDRLGEAAEWVAGLVRADLDWGELVERARRVPGLERLAEKYPGLRPGRCTSLYAALVDVIVRQRVALRVGSVLLARLVERYGHRAEAGGDRYYWYPRPEALAGAGVERLRSIPLPRLKARALVEVALAKLEGRLPSTREAVEDPEGATRELTRLYGVGPWTASLAVAMVHPRFPVGPSSDLAVRRGLGLLLGREPSPGEAREVLSALGDLAGLAMYLVAFEYETLKRGARS